MAPFRSPPWVVLAQNGEGAGGGGFGMWPAFVLIGLLFYFMLIRPQRREQANRAQMLEELQRNDRVVTIGGIYGMVTSVHKEKDEVTIRVDDKSRAELTVTKASVSRVITDKPGGDKDSGDKSSK